MIKRFITLFLMISLAFVLGACGKQKATMEQLTSNDLENESISGTIVTPGTTVTELKTGLSTVLHEGESGFNAFLAQGGASSDMGVVEFLMDNLLGGESLLFQNLPFGCSVLSAVDEDENTLFGRNFDWNNCEAWIMESRPINGYTSISTVNMDFITSASSMVNSLPDSLKTLAALYAPMDGMNEKGLCVAILMIQDGSTINQNTDKPDITTTTAVRLLLDKAANVKEAVELLGQYDMHASMGMMVHFALSDAEGNSVVVEYVNNEMVVIETSVVTNFYLAEGEKYGIGTAQSHERFDILTNLLQVSPVLSMADMRDAMDSVSKDNFGDEFASTEWSIVYNKITGEVHYYHRENYKKPFIFILEMSHEG